MLQVGIKLKIKNIDIFIHALHKKFYIFYILKSITLPIMHGKITILLGKSGSGKSTLLDLIIGLHKIDMGIIVLLQKFTISFLINNDIKKK